MNDLIEFLKTRLDEDEQWALAASAPYRYAIGNPPVPEGGVHWTWVVGENWEPVTPNPAEEEFVSIGDGWSCNLATVEEWQSVNGNWMMRRTYAGHIEEMDPSAAGHIARHDPARVLREVAAKRQLLQEVWTGMEDFAVNIEESRDGDDCGAREYRDQLLGILALAYSDHPDYQEAWRV
jgi:hypothetical protein